MQPTLGTARPQGKTQFALSQLIEFMTICAILSRLSTYIGIAAGISLMLMAFALAARQGMLALVLLAAASLLADWSLSQTFAGSLFCQSIILLIAAALCAWYRPRDNEQVRGAADIM
jgi:predicted membrane protein